jgi:hypothetical protein
MQAQPPRRTERRGRECPRRRRPASAAVLHWSAGSQLDRHIASGGAARRRRSMAPVPAIRSTYYRASIRGSNLVFVVARRGLEDLDPDIDRGLGVCAGVFARRIQLSTRPKFRVWQTSCCQARRRWWLYRACGCARSSEFDPNGLWRRQRGRETNARIVARLCGRRSRILRRSGTCRRGQYSCGRNVAHVALQRGQGPARGAPHRIQVRAEQQAPANTSTSICYGNGGTVSGLNAHRLVPRFTSLSGRTGPSAPRC